MDKQEKDYNIYALRQLSTTILGTCFLIVSHRKITPKESTIDLFLLKEKPTESIYSSTITAQNTELAKENALCESESHLSLLQINIAKNSNLNNLASQEVKFEEITNNPGEISVNLRAGLFNNSIVEIAQKTQSQSLRRYL